jgi:hypothetical protein
MTRWLSLVLAGLALAGCKLIDQTTFAPQAEMPEPAQLAALPPVGERPALLSIRYSTPNPQYGEALRTAVAAAEERRPGSIYDVVAVVPVPKDPALQLRDLDQGRQDATRVMQAMMALGVPDTRIALGARTDPSITVREVRVYVR